MNAVHSTASRPRLATSASAVPTTRSDLSGSEHCSTGGSSWTTSTCNSALSLRHSLPLVETLNIVTTPIFTQSDHMLYHTGSLSNRGSRKDAAFKWRRPNGRRPRCCQSIHRLVRRAPRFSHPPPPPYWAALVASPSPSPFVSLGRGRHVALPSAQVVGRPGRGRR